MSAPHGRGWLHYTLSVLLYAVLFGIVGPPVGAFIFGGLAMALLASDPSSSLLGFLLVALGAPFTIPVAYLIGFIAAAVTGAVVAVVTSVLAGGWIYGFAAAIGALAALGTSPNLAHSETAPYSSALAAAGAISACLCTLLTAGIRLRRPRNRVNG